MKERKVEKTSLGLRSVDGITLESPIELQCETYSILADWQKGIARNVQWDTKFPYPPNESTLRVVLFADSENDVSPTYCSGDADPRQMKLDGCRVVGFSTAVKPNVAGWIAAGWACAWNNENEMRQVLKDIAGVKKSK